MEGFLRVLGVPKVMSFHSHFGEADRGCGGD